jgi:nucleoside phosphorylase
MAGPRAGRKGIGDVAEISIGIVTALSIETLAVRSLFEHLDERHVPGDPNYYLTGTLPSTDPQRPHQVVIAQQLRDGTRNAAAVCTDLARSFERLHAFIMCGIAGAVPNHRRPAQHVRLGDIIVATDGVVDYDHVRTVDGHSSPRRHPDPPSTALLRADQWLETDELAGVRPWEDTIARVGGLDPFIRPGPATDVLHVNDRRTAHPPDAQRSSGVPRVHRGAIGSADRLLRDAVFRDRTALRHRILAFEMEGSGLAATAELHERSWFMVRGAADYCENRSKNDVWHPYAALAAAAYVGALLHRTRPLAPGSGASGEQALSGVGAVVDALLMLPQLGEEPGRRALIRQLPDYIRSSVPENANPRLHVLNIVQTCAGFPDGRDILLQGLRVIVGTSPVLGKVEAVIATNWTR